MFKELLIELIAGTSLLFGDFDYCNEGIRGMYYITLNSGVIVSTKIEICTNSSDLIFTILHELGHQYWYIRMDDKQREQYNTLQTDYIVDYSRKLGMTKPTEDFADNFANIILKRVDRNGTENYRNKIDFINKILRND